MHFFAAQDQLSRALSQVSRAISPQNNMAVLSGVQFEVLDGRLYLTATDLYTQITAELPVEASEPGYIVLPATTITELIQRLPTATVEIQSDAVEGRAMVRYARNRATIHAFGSDRLPDFPEFSHELESISLPAGAFSALARQLLFATAKDESRPILRGVFVKLGNGRLVAAATDGSRLSQSWIPLPDYRGREIEAIFPPKLLVEGARISAQSPVEITISHDLVRLSAQDVKVTSRLLDGQYPDYQRVIPQEYMVQGRVLISDLRGALERVNLIASKDRSASVKISHHLGTLEIAASAQELGQAFEALDFDSHGPEMELLFNPTYFLDGLKSLEGDEAVIEFSGIQSPARIREAESSQYFHILLPLRQLV